MANDTFLRRIATWNRVYCVGFVHGWGLQSSVLGLFDCFKTNGKEIKDRRGEKWIMLHRRNDDDFDVI